MTNKYEEIVMYKPVKPREVIEKWPFWWFTEIAVSFKNRKKTEIIVYGVSPNELFPLNGYESPFADMEPTLLESKIPYDKKEYPERRDFENFPPPQGSPFLIGIEELLLQNNSSFDEIDMVAGTMRWYSMARGLIDVITLVYKKKKRSATFGRIIFDQPQMNHLDDGGIAYLDRVFDKLSR